MISFFVTVVELVIMMDKKSSKKRSIKPIYNSLWTSVYQGRVNMWTSVSRTSKYIAFRSLSSFPWTILMDENGVSLFPNTIIYHFEQFKDLKKKKKTSCKFQGRKQYFLSRCFVIVLFISFFIFFKFKNKFHSCPPILLVTNYILTF